MPDKPADNFDPYYKWLGIPPAFQPPDHYRLLGLRQFEEDPEVIAVASDRQMAHVKSYSVGKYGQHSQKLLEELAKAKICLLNPVKKAEYDSELAEQVMPIGEIESLTRSTDSRTKLVVQNSELLSQKAPEIYVYESINSRRRRRQEKSLLIPFLIASLTLASAGLIALQSKALKKPTANQVNSSEKVDTQGKDEQSERKEEFVQRQEQRDKRFNNLEKNKKREDKKDREDLDKDQDKGQGNEEHKERVDPPKPKLQGLPAFVNLPPPTDRQVQALCEVPEDSSVTLRSSSNLLQFDGEKITWGTDNPQLIGGLTVHECAVKFRWAENPPADAELAIRNSLAMIMLGSEMHTFALRSPLVVEPYRYDLTKPVHRILGTCQYLPDVDLIEFEVLNCEAMPPFNDSAIPGIHLKSEQTEIANYLASSFVKTTFQMRKIGNVPSVVLTSRFGLPSGSDAPLMLKQLNRIRQLIRGDLDGIDFDLRQLRNARNKGTARHRAEIDSSIRMLESQRDAAIRDKEELTKIESLTEKLNVLALHYRFFILVAGYEINLITTQKE